MFLALAIVAIGATPPAALCGPQHYVLVFGGQSEKNRPRTAHTWATYVRAEGGTVVESCTISWLPATLKVRPLSLRPEAGVNLTLHQSLDFMANGNHDVSFWGPFAISEDYYRSAIRQKQTLDATSLFRTLNSRDRRPDINHCVHAVAKTDDALDEACHPIIWYGQAITQRLVNAMVKVDLVCEPHVTHDWLIPALGLNAYQLKRELAGQSGFRHLLPAR